MSAAVAWDTVPTTARRSAPTRPDLRLVPTGREARRQSSAARPALRVSRFGRLLLTVAVLVVAVALAVTVLGAGSASAGIDHTVTVRSGQTLSEVAAHELPQLAVSEGVAQIQLLNHLSSAEVHAGQQLAIPSIP